MFGRNNVIKIKLLGMWRINKKALVTRPHFIKCVNYVFRPRKKNNSRIFSCLLVRDEQKILDSTWLEFLTVKESFQLVNKGKRILDITVQNSSEFVHKL